MSLTAERSMLRQCHRCWQLRHHLFRIASSSRSIGTSKPLLRKPNSYYDVLGIHQEASQSEIKAAFVALSKEIHPDLNPKDPTNHDRFVKLSEAYTVLSKPQSRREYDFSLATQWQYEQGLRRAAYGNHYPGASAAPGSSSTGSYDGEQAQPFMDETIWSMRDRSKDGSSGSHAYYGIKGVRKVSNMAIVGGCMLFMGVGMILHFLAFSYSTNYSQKILDEKNRVNHAILKETRERARLNGNVKQLEILKARVEAMKETQTKTS